VVGTVYHTGKVETRALVALKLACIVEVNSRIPVTTGCNDDLTQNASSNCHVFSFSVFRFFFFNV
jgi:hypothetical protein